MKKKIMIVDDEQYNRMAVGVILGVVGLQNTGDKCDYAINGQDALDQVKKDIETNNGAYCSYDLILMDCNMPVMDGYEATTKIREFIHEKSLCQPIISGVTGHIEPAYVKRSINSGMNQVFSKPVNIELLKKLLTKLGYL